MRQFLILLSSGLILAACLSTTTAPEIAPEFDYEIPQTWATPPAPEQGSISCWWIDFNDSKLSGIIELLLTQNYDLVSAAYRIDAAISQAGIAGAQLAPHLGTGIDLARRKNFLVFPVPGGGDNALSTTSTTLGISLNLNWEIDLWGRLRAAHRAYLTDVEVSMADLAAIQLSLAGQTCKAWFSAVEILQQIDLAEATLDNFETTHKQVRSRYERGLRPSLDVRLSESNVATAKSILLQRREQYQRIIRQIEILLGSYPSGTLALSEILPRISAVVPAGIPADIIRRRPDLVAAERRLAAANSRFIEARRSLYPRLSLTASGGRSSDELSDLLDGNFTVWSAVGNLVQPLLQGGRLRAGVDLAAIREKQALANFAQSVLDACAEVETALAAENILSQREQALEIAAEQALAARNLAEDRYASGLLDFIAVLEAQSRAFEARSQLTSVRRQRLDARVDLYLALGGGFSRKSFMEEGKPQCEKY